MWRCYDSYEWSELKTFFTVLKVKSNLVDWVEKCDIKREEKTKQNKTKTKQICYDCFKWSGWSEWKSM